MRSRHPLIRPDDPPWDEHSELKLPNDLALLAEQLGDDAERLAEQYPAESLSPALMSGTPGPLVRHNIRWIGLAAAVLVVVVAGWTTVETMVPGDRVRARVRDVERQDRLQASGSLPGIKLNTAEPSHRFSPALRVPDLTGPELEGVLDLLEHESDELAELSI